MPVPAGRSIGAAWRPCADSFALTGQGDEPIRWRVSLATRRAQASRAGGPRRGWMCGDGDVHDAPAMVSQDDQHEHEAAGRWRDRSRTWIWWRNASSSTSRTARMRKRPRRVSRNDVRTDIVGEKGNHGAVATSSVAIRKACSAGATGFRSFANVARCDVSGGRQSAPTLGSSLRSGWIRRC